MSSTCLKIAYKDGDVDTYQEYANSWGGMAYIWDCLYVQYLKDPKIPHDTWLMNHDSKKLWSLHKDPRLPDWAALVMLMTYDYALVEYDKLPKMAKCLRQFVKAYPPGNKACHLSSWADNMDKIYKEQQDCAGVGLYGTSVSEDLWWTYDSAEDEDEEGRPYNLSKDEKHWFIFEEYEAIKEEA